MLGRWNFPSQLREGKTPQTQPLAETKEKEYTRRLTRRGNSNVLAHFSSIRVLTVLLGRSLCSGWVGVRIINGDLGERGGGT